MYSPLILLETLKHYIILYYLFFFFLFVFCWVSNFYLYRHTKKWFIGIVICILAIIIGGRGLNIGTDTLNYSHIFESVANSSLQELPLLDEPIFFLFTKFLSILGDYRFYLFLISLTTLLLTYYYCILIKYYESVILPVLLFFCIAITQVFFNQQVNIIRVGFAMPFLLLFSYFLCLNSRKSIIYACVAFGIHQTMIIPILIFCFIRYIKLSWFWYYVVYLVAIVLSYLGIGVHRLSFLLGLDSKKIDLYFSSNYWDYRTGFRLDFVLFNTLFLLIFLVLKQDDRLIGYYIKYYIMMSALFFLWFYIPFSDRIGAFAWNYIPIILYISSCKYFSSKRVKYGSLTFLFLFIVNIFLTGIFTMQ